MHSFLAALALSRSASVALAISLGAVLLGAPRASAVPPANDLCSTPVLLSEGVVAGPFSTLEAADDYAPGCVALDGPDTVHEFTLTIDAATLVIVTPQTPQWGLVAALRTSPGCTALPDLACVGDGFEERYINAPHLTAGTYDVLVDGKAGASGRER